MGAAGRLVIPAKVRKLLDLHPGQRVQLQLHDDTLQVTVAGDALARAQAIARQHPPEEDGRRLSDALIDDRRRAAARGE